MKLTDYVFTEDMTFDEFIEANPEADASLEEDEDLSEAIMVYSSLKAQAERRKQINYPSDELQR